MRILITGAYATGKSELVAAVLRWARENLITAVAINEVARSSPFALNRQQSEDGTNWLYLKQLLNEAESVLRHATLTIMDRGVPDILSHALEMEKRIGVRSKLPTRFEALSRHSVESFTRIYRTTVSEAYPIVTDGLRNPDRAFRREMERHHIDAVKHLGVEAITLPNGLAPRLKIITQDVVALLEADRTLRMPDR